MTREDLFYCFPQIKPSGNDEKQCIFHGHDSRPVGNKHVRPTRECERKTNPVVPIIVSVGNVSYRPYNYSAHIGHA